MTVDEKLSYLQRRISPQESMDDLLRYPRYLEIETVNACNARCPMCTIDEWERQTPTMKDDVFDHIARDVIAHADQLKRVSLYRDGEPLLDKKIAGRVAMLKAGGVKEVSISSNLSLLDEKRSRALLDAGLDLLIMSIDSLDKAVFESIRVKLNHEEVMENALRFIRLRDEINPGTRIWVRMIRQQSNMGEWESFRQFWLERVQPSDRVYYHDLFNWGGQLAGATASPSCSEFNNPCVALWSLMVILGNGDVPLCNVDFNNKYPVGNVLDESIESLWNSKTFQHRRNLHLQGRKGEISLCNNCNVWEEVTE